MGAFYYNKTKVRGYHNISSSLTILKKFQRKVRKMGKKKNDNIELYFIGQNTNTVTGSCIYGQIQNENFKFLLECGGYQEETALKNYDVNEKLVAQIDAINLNCIFLNHQHIDHIMLVPALIKKGFHGKIYCPKGMIQLAHLLWIDCCHIIKDDVKYISTKKASRVELLYTEDDVNRTLDYVYECDFDKEYEINDNIKFNFLKNNHITSASQLEFWYKDEASHQHKFLYTSDMGNQLPKYYVNDMEYCKTANVMICESTYGSNAKTISKTNRKQELKILQDTICDTIINKKGCALIPCFSLDRSQNLMTILYKMFKDREEFKNIDFVIDGKLTNALNKAYLEVLEGEQLDLFQEVMKWKNFKFITDYKETAACVHDMNPKVVISSSGFADKGHIVSYIKEYISNKNDTIIFVGYASPSSLAGRLRDTSKKHITIEKGNYSFNCNVIVLNTFSSHIQQEQIINYFKRISISDGIILVHGDKDCKIELQAKGREELSKINKTTPITIATKGMKINI